MTILRPSNKAAICGRFRYGGIGKPVMIFQARRSANEIRPRPDTWSIGLQITTPPDWSVFDHQTEPTNDRFQQTKPSGGDARRPQGATGENPGA